jgi:hypothetical protein
MQVKFTLLFIFNFLLVLAQDCPPPGDLTFQSQSELNNFIAQYPNCQVINGNMRVTRTGFDGYSDINNLSPLSNITTVNGSLTLEFLGNITSLVALSNLQTINGNLNLYRNANYFVNYNNSNYVQGLTSLTTITGKLTVADVLTNFSGLSNLTQLGGIDVIYSNIDSFQGLENITSMNSFWVGANAILSFNGLQNLTNITGDFELSISSLTGEIPPAVLLNNLSNITTVGGNFTAFGSYEQTANNIPQTKLDFLSNLTTVGQNFTLWVFNAEDFNDLSNLQSVGGDTTLSVYATSLEGLSNQAISNKLFLSASNITDLSGLDDFTNLKGLSISGCANLTSLNGLQALTMVDGPIIITDNAVLNNITALSNVNPNFVLGSNNLDLEISNNPNLALCSNDLVCGMLNLPFREIVISNNAIGCHNKPTAFNNCVTFLSNEAFEQAIDYAFVNNILTINNKDVLSMTCLNMMGQNVIRTSKQNVIDLNQVETGLYFVVVEDSNNQTYKMKVVKK